MIFSKEQFEWLTKYEGHFEKMIKAKWSPTMPSSDVTRMADIYNAVTGEGRRVNTMCSRCICNLIEDTGHLYFRDKEEREKAKAKKVVASKEGGKTRKKVKVDLDK